MDERRRAQFRALLAPKPPTRWRIAQALLLIAVGAAATAGAMLADGARPLLVMGCGLLLMGNAEFARGWDGLCAVSLSGVGGLLTMLGGALLMDPPWVFRTVAVLIALLCAFVTIGLRRWQRVLNEVRDVAEVFD